MKEITVIDIGDEIIYTCDNCGGFSRDPDSLLHYPTCQPGEAKKWEEYYKDEEGDWEDYHIIPPRRRRA